ncbi:MAG TPA: hypothetical protein VFQ44_20045 [Streptosporangiaceae bacterium]|nr:hypothetical protein [Streptosporangiaceae bacterium]
MSGEVTVKAGHPSVHAGEFVPGTSVKLSLPPAEPLPGAAAMGAGA